MKTSIDFLNDAKSQINAKTQTELANALNCKQNSISNYLSGNRVIDDYTAAQIANILNIDAITVIAAANADRETDVKRKKWWENISKRLTNIALIILLINPSVTEAAARFNDLTCYTLCAVI